VLDCIVDEALLNTDFLIPFWHSYVDDHITAIPEDKIQQVLDKLHEFDPKIKFTCEMESGQQLNYLDVTIHRSDEGKMITNWYHKPMASNRLLNFYSNHPQRMKFNVAKSFIRKIFRLSHKNFWKNNLLRIKSILKRNNYPDKIIDKLIRDVQCHKSRTGTDSYAYLSTNHTNLTTNLTANQTTQASQFSSLAYIPGLSESISNTCKEFVPEVQLAMRPHFKNSSMFTNLKSNIPRDEKSGVVYKIECADCSAVYIGETKQKLGARKNQHQYDCRKNVTKNSSALAIHANEQSHSFDFDNAKILKCERNKLKLQIQEVNQIIIHEKTACNKKTDKKDYTNAYINLIKTKDKNY